MSPFPTPSYIEIPRAPSAEEIQRLNSFCNQLIRDGAPITVNVTLQEELAERPSKLPEDYEGGVVREVQIHHPLLKMAKGPCCGTHLPNISMLQAMQILPNVTSIRGTNFRLYFLVGGRVLENAAKAMEAVRLSALQFGGTEDLPGRVEATLANLRDANRRERRLREELADFLADKLAAQAQQNSRRLALLVRQDEELDSLIGITSKLKTLPGAVDNPCFILISQNTSGSCPLVVIGEAARSKEVIDAMRAEFGARLKGGGKGIFQGKLEGKAGKKEIAFLESLLLSTE
jgi:misacylated tRNA(Ala) deacylase